MRVQYFEHLRSWRLRTGWGPSLVAAVVLDKVLVRCQCSEHRRSGRRTCRVSSWTPWSAVDVVLAKVQCFEHRRFGHHVPVGALPLLAVLVLDGVLVKGQCSEHRFLGVLVLVGPFPLSPQWS